MVHPNVESSMLYDDLCTGCGLCCIAKLSCPVEYTFKDAEHNDYNHTSKDCQYLKRLDNSLTLCKIHGRHTGTMIRQEKIGDKTYTWYCGEIMDIPTLFEDCPYNELKIKAKLEHK